MTQMSPTIARLTPTLIVIHKPVYHATQARRVFLAEGYRTPLVGGVDECLRTRSESPCPSCQGAYGGVVATLCHLRDRPRY